MAVTLNKAYGGYLQGTVASFPSSTEAAIVAQGIGATALVTATTTGAVRSEQMSGTVAIAAGASSLVVTNPYVDASTVVEAFVSQATADTTLTSVLRVVSAAGSFTIFGNANATATTLVKWAIVGATGVFPSN